MATAKQILIQDFVAGLRQFPERIRPNETVRDFCRRIQSTQFARAYLTWDRQHYTRNLIDKTSLYELLAICWEIGQASSVHNHRDQNCWMAVPIGRLQVENFRVVQQDFAAGQCELRPTETVEMNRRIRAPLIRTNLCIACSIPGNSTSAR